VMYFFNAIFRRIVCAVGAKM